MNTNGNQKTMSDFEVALMDAIRTILEVIVAKKLVPPEVLAEMLAAQKNRYPDDMPGAIFVMDALRSCLIDPVREQARKFANDPPAGPA